MSARTPGNVIRWLFDCRFGPADRLIPRWIFLRALAAIYFSAFYSLLFQIKGEIGPEGVLPAGQYLSALARMTGGVQRLLFAPTLYWISASSTMLIVVTWIGVVASLLALLNVWPRVSFFVCWACFLAFVAAAQDFSSYQSDGMLLEAGFLSLFLAPRGVWPSWGAKSAPIRASLWLLQWEWFRIYFESGMVKLLSGDEEWRHLTAMDEYYQNGPLPTWIGWYVQHLPHWFQVATAAGTLLMELGVVLMFFLGRRVRLACFVIVTLWEIPVILTANYTFLNYLVLSLGFLLLDDKMLMRFVPARWRPREIPEAVPQREEEQLSILTNETEDQDEVAGENARTVRMPEYARGFAVAATAVVLTWIAYDTTAEMLRLVWREVPLPTAPIAWLEPFRIANQYGLFAVMTRGRYEIEFQGSDDGDNWTPYLFRYKPQLVDEAPGVYAPYQPRFDWNLWFASLGVWHQSDIVPLTEERLLENSGDVLALFKGSPFGEKAPKYVRAVLWQYWFTSMDEKRRTGNWWKRQLLGLYAPEITRTEDGRFAVVMWPEASGPHE